MRCSNVNLSSRRERTEHGVADDHVLSREETTINRSRMHFGFRVERDIDRDIERKVGSDQARIYIPYQHVTRSLHMASDIETFELSYICHCL